jgi:imidazoleglycerol-phosphate dehydratase
MRKATIERKTKETDIKVELNLDGSGKANIDTGICFLDHMLNSLACHGNFDLNISCRGDLNVDDHHSSEDCAIVIGEAIEKALGDKKGIARFSCRYAPMDESLARTVIDISGRAYSVTCMDFTQYMIGDIASQNIIHFFKSLAAAARITLHVDVIRGENDHHKAEAAFKSFALALKGAVALINQDKVISTKGVL